MNAFTRDSFFEFTRELLRTLCILGYLSGIVSAPAQLPEESRDLLKKLADFEAQEKAELEAFTAEKRETAAALLKRHLEKRKGAGELDAAIAIKEAIDSLGTPDALEISEQLPEDTSAILKKLQQFELANESEVEAKISEKKRAVVGLLEKQMKVETREGRLKQAIALNDTINSFQEESGEEKSNVESRSGIPDDSIEHGGAHFKAYVTPTSIEWDEAREECRKVGGRLAWFDSPSDEKLIRTLLEGVNEQVGHVPVWVGALKADPKAPWLWLNGEPVDPDFWANAGDADTHEDDIVLARWIGSFKCYRKDHHRVVGYICRWE